ncbi:hypothetical protein F2P45_14320 [Massilia sp. CCM 8733]|uniref:Transcriptional regulator n=1 Tax=Massilia mucilaginosa TaxID=2609282 RepID=A0ABX0NTM7_9BURK|nr:hypothetical protein [Massilia mucilaginosa]NHZ90182.1 hypothetical protein [Massilia mucilaginosa]
MDEAPRRIADRLRSLIDARTDKRGKFAQLEELTLIPAENWKSFYYNRQRPNPDMIEALAIAWPECAFWLATGIEDELHGHLDPTREHDSIYARDKANPYFEKKLELLRFKNHKFDGEHEAWVKQIEKFEAQLGVLAQIRSEQETTLEKFDRDSPIAF